jgi:hypothetical protein
MTAALTNTNIAIKAIGLQKIGDDAVKFTDFALSVFRLRTRDLRDCYFTSVEVQVHDMSVVMPDNLF